MRHVTDDVRRIVRHLVMDKRETKVVYRCGDRLQSVTFDPRPLPSGVTDKRVRCLSRCRLYCCPFYGNRSPTSPPMPLSAATAASIARGRHTICTFSRLSLLAFII